jgi:hypothetical protein
VYGAGGAGGAEYQEGRSSVRLDVKQTTLARREKLALYLPIRDLATVADLQNWNAYVNQ